MIIRGSMK